MNPGERWPLPKSWHLIWTPMEGDNFFQVYRYKNIPQPHSLTLRINSHPISQRMSWSAKEFIWKQFLASVSECYILTIFINLIRNALTLYHWFTDVTDHHNDLIGDISPTPNAFMVRIISFDKRIVRIANKFKIPFVLGGYPGIIIQVMLERWREKHGNKADR